MGLPHILDIFLHLDTHLDEFIQSYGTLTYGLLGLIVFCETGLVVTPFLPGDSLLFVAGASAARGGLDLWSIMLLLFVAAVVGDAVNYYVGSRIGSKVFESNSKIFKRHYIERTQLFFEKYGGKAIIFARFVPIVRTFAPFLAGVGKMSYAKFGLYNVIGGALWVLLFVGAGFLFGEIPLIKKNFTVVILLIIVASLIPAILEAVKARREGRQASLSQDGIAK